MAIYNQRAEFSQEQFESHFQKRNSILNTVYGIVRFLIIIAENLYCIPSYLVLSWVILLPASWFKNGLYSRLENYLYNSLLFIVSSWSLAAGLTVVEAGDEFKHLIEEPENQYPDRAITVNDETGKKRQTSIACNNNNNNIDVAQRYLDGDCRVVEHLVKKPKAPRLVNGHVRAKLNSNGLISNGFSDDAAYDDKNQAGGDQLDEVRQENGLDGSKDARKQMTTDSNEPLKNNNDNLSEKTNSATKWNDRSIQTISSKSITREAALVKRYAAECKHHTLKMIQARPRILLLCNHISTADVPLIMQSFSTLTNQSILWVLDAQFKLTNFGVVCGSHGDFFVSKNSYVDGSIREHVLKYPDRNLLVLFPEGGFLRKRIDGSNRYAIRNGLPLTKYVTHPRFGAFKDLIDPSVGVTHIVDATLIYDDIKNPISIIDIGLGNKKEPAILHFKVYNRSEINPTEEWLRNIWLEKDKLLAKYYEDRTNILKKFAKTFRVAKLDWFKTLSIHLFYLLVCYLAIIRLFNATSVTMLKARELYYSNI
uniref:Acyl-CoA:lysophosphatidylglycerol acyltransferase 1 n=1 Tax=Aceria tosichella TaxID=561515 RepID=A0A6G1SJ31_9ACAR